MAKLIVLVVDDPAKVSDVLEAWGRQGIKGVTILDSSGMGRQVFRGVGLPLFPSVRSVLRSSEEHHRTLLAVVHDDFDVRALVGVTESITGHLDDPNTGILFVVPVTEAYGLDRREGHDEGRRPEDDG